MKRLKNAIKSFSEFGVNPRTLRFDSKQEYAFQFYYNIHFGQQSQFVLSFSALLVIMFGIGDLSFETDLQKSMFFLRYFVTTPLLVIFSVLIWIRPLRAYIQYFLLGGFSVSIIPLNILILLLPSGLGERYTMALLVMIMLTFSLSRMQFIFCFISTLFLLPLSLVVMLIKTSNFDTARIYSLYISAGFVIGLITCYFLEYSIRKSYFFQVKKIEAVRHLTLLSDNQEQIIERKTKELKIAFYDLDAAYIETINRMAKIAEFRDPETGEHIQRVSLYVRFICEKLGLDSETAHAYQIASIMHDVGKVGIPDNILFKTDTLTKGEWTIMCKHTDIGGKVFDNAYSNVLIHARDIALQHHEKWNGSGYPKGLKGDKIALSARIMALADVYDALRSRRQYKGEINHSRVVQIIKEGDNRVSPEDFDPQIIKIFLENHEMFNEIYNSNIDQVDPEI